jgi:2'-5' RNA ligase
MPRLFIAAGLPENLRPVLAEAQQVLRRHASHIRVTPLHNLHLTLRFIGEVEEERAAGILEWFGGLVLPPEEERLISLQRYGAFPGSKGALLWAGLACGPGLLEMVHQIGRGLQTLGFPAESRPFLPHITLARQVELVQPLEVVLDMLPIAETGSPIPGVSLYRSVLNPRGPEYRSLISL